MDQISLIVQAVSFVFGIGIIYGSFNSRLKSIERELNEYKQVSERLARIEEQIKMIFEILKK
jgi:glucose-6-phosphate-specific signal transduction histidine kinase